MNLLVDSGIIVITGIETEKTVLALETEAKVEDFNLDIETEIVTRE